MILEKKYDPMGLAIKEYAENNLESTIQIFSPDFDEDSIPTSYLFREFKDFPTNEKKALSLVKGKTLDIGAAAGIHSKYLIEKNIDVSAIDISPYTIEYLKSENINAQLSDIFDFESDTKFDTVLLLMNGLGIAETNNKLPLFLEKLSNLLTPQGKILVESCSLNYLFDDEEEAENHNGEIIYQMKYKNTEGLYFSWLYKSFDDLKNTCTKLNLSCKLISNEDNGQYLAQIKLN